MNKPMVASLLAAWCVLTITPAWLVVEIFSGMDENSNVTGPIFGFWIVGYLLQFGVFMVVARNAPGNSIVGWLLASTVPFVADWTAPVPGVRWVSAICAVVVISYSVWFYRRLARSNTLQHNGIPAVGVVLEVKQPIMNTIINSVYIRRTMRLRIERSDGAAPYEAKYSGTFMLGEIPSPGAVFNLRVDPRDPMHFETVEPPRRRLQTVEPPRRRLQTVDGTAATDLASAPPSHVAEQLQQLDHMHRRGALTDDEFAAAKQRVLRG